MSTIYPEEKDIFYKYFQSYNLEDAYKHRIHLNSYLKQKKQPPLNMPLKRNISKKTIFSPRAGKAKGNDPRLAMIKKESIKNFCQQLNCVS
mmetsp:Transcript_34503/g.33699  ORF Transcript_34503/g.33699 Transcript_34503/m.33699 type:complete len:91 (+) Transcript_34503:735-1007(+)